jgi:hypothetical protein
MERRVGDRGRILEAAQVNDDKVPASSIVLFFALLSAFIAALELRTYFPAISARPVIAASSATNPGVLIVKDRATAPRL